MKVKLDENMPASVTAIMIEKGHDVETVYTEGLQGASDKSLAEACLAEDRALITLDLDFANIAAYPPQQYSGILVLRPGDQSVPCIIALIKRLVLALAKSSPAGALWIVEPTRIRVSNLEPPDSIE